MKTTLFILLLFFSSLSAETLTRTKVALGTFVSISADEKYAKEMDAAFSVIDEVEASLSSYAKNSPIYKLNTDKQALLHPFTYEALLLSKKYYAQTQGYFDITVGSITKDLYRFGEDERLPNAAQLQNAVVNFKSLRFNEHNASLFGETKVDLGGMGKGFAVDKAVAFLAQKSVTNAVVSASGDIRCMQICKIEVQNPLGDDFLASFQTREPDMAISTSGNYNRYVKNTDNNHLINPKTKSSQKNFLSLTLISHLPNSDIDAYATAASVMPLDKAYAFLDSLALAYIVLERDKKIVVSQNIETYTKAYVTLVADK